MASPALPSAVPAGPPTPSEGLFNSFPLAFAFGTKEQRRTRTRTHTGFQFATKSGPFNSILKRCEKCGGKGSIECPGCKGTGKNKKNGNIFERWKCFDCQGFGLKSCPKCGQGGLTPEQRGER